MSPNLFLGRLFALVELKLIQIEISLKIREMALFLELMFPSCRQDSVVSDKVNYDLLKRCLAVQQAEDPCEELLGHVNRTKTSEDIPNSITKHLTLCC